MVNPLEERLSFSLSRAEALVLFEWLASHESLPVEHKGEQEALWRLEGALERILVEVFAPNYTDLVVAARAFLAPSSEDQGPGET